MLADAQPGGEAYGRAVSATAESAELASLESGRYDGSLDRMFHGGRLHIFTHGGLVVIVWLALHGEDGLPARARRANA
jgi:hypothetical protein